MTNNNLPGSISRRNLLTGAAAVAAVLATNQTLAASGHYHHHAPNVHGDLINKALDCVNKGNACTQHCIELVKQGDTSIASCLDAVADMLPMCNTLAKLAASPSAHLAAFAQVCILVCEDCEKECRKHEDKHAECKACAESCAACIAECKKIVA